MSLSARSSPDPLTLASSPPGTRLERNDNDLSARQTQYARHVSHESPSRPSTLDPRNGRDGREKSPWRLRVTMEADSNDMAFSPDQSMTRSMTIPLYDIQISSPDKRRYRKTPGLDETLEIKVPSRKRRRSVPHRSDREDRVSASIHGEGETGPEHIHKQPSQETRALPTLVEESRHRSQDPTERLGLAAHAPRAKSHPRAIPSVHSPGDLTVSMNEEFTMVSVNSLQGYKERARGRSLGLGAHSDYAGENSMLDNVTIKQEPQQSIETEDVVLYPDLTSEVGPLADPIKDTAPVAPTYDAMSWKYTGPATNIVPEVEDQSSPIARTDAFVEPTEWQLERAAVSRQIQNATASQIIVINDTTVEPEAADESITNGNIDEADIWQEEASRSIHEEEHVQRHGSRKRHLDDSPSRAQERSPQLGDIFIDEPIRPRRAKIPRTWRRKSGMDFAYSDSPDRKDHIDISIGEVPPSPSKRNGNSDGESRDSGVLTPPSTDDEKHRRAAEGHEPDTFIDLTEPDAAATQLAEHPVGDAQYALLSDEEDDVENDEHDSDVELAPFVDFRVRRLMRKAADLSDILPHSSSPARPARNTHDEHGVDIAASERETESLQSPQQSRKTIVFDPFVPKLTPRMRSPNSSPAARRSLFRPSYIRGSPIRTRRDSTNYLAVDYKAEMAGLRKSSILASNREDDLSVSDRDAPEELGNLDHTVVDEDTNIYDPTNSYQEDLNLASPTKVQVNFNDSLRNASLLVPRRAYPSLFEDDTTIDAAQPAHTTATHPEEDTTQPPKPNFISRITSSLWSTIIRPSGPAEIYPTNAIPEPDFPSDLRARIRSRYGVVSKIHTWNMVHMRTLHRMVNSITSGKSDSIIPRKGPLPSYLSRLVDSRQRSVGNYEYIFDMQNAQIVFAFLQIMVEPSLVAAMEEGEISFLGDAAAKSYRETDVLGRKGKDSPWPYDKYKIVVPQEGTLIDWVFVVRALGDAVFAHEWELKQVAGKAGTT